MKVLEEELFEAMLDEAARRGWAALGDRSVGEHEFVVRARELCAWALAKREPIVSCHESTLCVERVETEPGVFVVSVRLLVPCGVAVGIFDAR